ncbi:hypothetical protein PRN20_19615 [Devosia sp. ZB163]|uniref:hypothetical protein n=1 Tax=Devosia sp. ZB163 TaxID=3025938 RepID=UPI00235E8ED1|nr:hypothetical protein [Devosia sp. ZB163]MDC9825949.1 hypothetical protein [Devosia sp. ZB163]
MTSKAALFALLAMWGVGSTLCLPAFAEEAATESASESKTSKPGLVDRVWTKTDGDLPGVMRIFLSDGTLVQDSCWETHRLSSWELTSDTALKWNEDGMDIAADIVSLTDGELVLSLKLGSDAVEEKYVSATVPFVCPDIPKS